MKQPIPPIVGQHQHVKSNQEAQPLKSIERQLQSRDDNIFGLDVGMHKPTVMVECFAKRFATSTI
jgi:hypothetical protein